MEELRNAEEAKNKLFREGQMPPERSPFKKGVNYHKWNGIKYDVDTFYDELAWEEVIRTKDRFLHRTWFYNKSDYNCPSCGSHADVVFNIQSTGVCMKCNFCQLTTLAIPFNINDSGTEEAEIAELLETKEVSVKEAVEIMTRTGQDQRWIQPYLPRTSIERKRHVRNSEEEK